MRDLTQQIRTVIRDGVERGEFADTDVDAVVQAVTDLAIAGLVRG